MWLTRLALRNPVFILMMSLMVCVLGYVSLSKLSVDLFPDITIPIIRVATFYPGSGPADIEKSVTEPIERAVAATPKRRHPHALNTSVTVTASSIPRPFAVWSTRRRCS